MTEEISVFLKLLRCILCIGAICLRDVDNAWGENLKLKDDVHCFVIKTG